MLDGPGLHAANQLAFPVYNVILGLNPAWVGYALASFRLWDAFTDPLAGYLTDRSASRWGRRKPFMLLGAVFCAVLFPLAWFASPAWSATGQITFFVAISLLYFTAHTIYAIPYQALGMELTPDYDDRTSLYTYRTCFMVLGFAAIGWVYPLAQHDWFYSPLAGVQIVTVAMSVVFFLSALVPILVLRERFQAPAVAVPAKSGSEGGDGFWCTMAAAFRNREFRRLASLQVILVFGGNVVAVLSFYVNLYYLYDGNAKAAAQLMGTGALVSSAATLAAMPLLPWLSRRLGKAGTVACCLTVQLLASALKWVLFIPSAPWLSLIPVTLISIGNIGFWTLVPAMVADVCDLDELETGKRREGLFASVTQWLNKLGYTAATALSGTVLVWIGFDVAKEGVQSESTLFLMRLLFAVVPATAFLAGLWLLRGMNLSRQRLQAVRVELESRRGVR